MRRARVFTPRRVRKASNGPAMAPTAFCRKPRRSASSAFCPTTAMPPITSEWPLRYLVVECSTMSKPSSSGRWIHGLAKVLSATQMMPRARQVRAMAARSVRRSSGLLGVSTMTMRVSSCRDASNAARSVRSTKLKRCPALRWRTLSNRRKVPPYRSLPETMCEPASSSSSTVEMVASPEAKAKPRVPPSRSATQRSSAQRVGLCERP
ncbi:hypothetical protein D3C86_1349330 [compost metagenome]